MFCDFLKPDTTKPEVTLLSRFHRFFHGLLDSPSPEVQTMVRLSARDLRTNTGRNLAYIEQETGLNPWVFGTNRIKDELRQTHATKIPDNEKWRLIYLEKLMCTKLMAYYDGNGDLEAEISCLIDSLVCS